LPIIKILQKFNAYLSPVLGSLEDTYSMQRFPNSFIMQPHLIRIPITLLYLLIAVPCLASNQTLLSPLPSKVIETWNGLEFIGQTSLHRFGFHVYDSSYWEVNKATASKQICSSICALSITYARKIRAQQLLSSTKKEWLRLGFADQYPIDAWLVELSKIWPDVEKGDQLILVASNDGRSTFFNMHQELGTIEDPEFGNAFLSIWISDNARFSKNRKELLGE